MIIGSVIFVIIHNGIHEEGKSCKQVSFDNIMFPDIPLLLLIRNILSEKPLFFSFPCCVLVPIVIDWEDPIYMVFFCLSNSMCSSWCDATLLTDSWNSFNIKKVLKTYQSGFGKMLTTYKEQM